MRGRSCLEAITEPPFPAKHQMSRKALTERACMQLHSSLLSLPSLSIVLVIARESKHSPQWAPSNSNIANKKQSKSDTSNRFHHFGDLRAPIPFAAQQGYLSYRAMLVAMISRIAFVRILMGYRADVAR